MRSRLIGSTVARARSPRIFALAGVTARRWVMSVGTSRASHTKPLRPFSISSAAPDLRLVMTGKPLAMASSATLGNGLKPAGVAVPAHHQQKCIGRQRGHGFQQGRHALALETGTDEQKQGGIVGNTVTRTDLGAMLLLVGMGGG